MGKKDRWPEFLEAYDETGMHDETGGYEGPTSYDGPASFNELDSELGDELENYTGDELNGCDEFEPRGSFAVLVGEGDPICENCVNWDGQYCNIAGQAGHGGRCDGR